MKHTFGRFLKAKRLTLDLSLRDFARKAGMQPSNYCNIESDVLPAPPAESLERISKLIGLKRGTPDYTKFHDLAAKARHEIPADVERVVKENKLIPAMLRTVEYEKVTQEQLRGIIEDIRSGRYKKTNR